MSDTSLRRLLIIQPYVPEYRVPFFHALVQELHEAGVQAAVAAARSTGAQAARGDDRTSAAAEYLLPEHHFSLGSKTLLWRSTREAIRSFGPEFIIVEQAIKNLEAWPLLLASRLASSRRVGMWGQGRSYSTEQSPVEATAKQWLTRQADWFFSYTERGAQHVIEHGFPADRVTIVQNSTDTQPLRRDVASVTRQELELFRQRHGLIPGKTALFMGGVDERKGINFLLKSAWEIERQVPGFRLMVAGSGDMSTDVVAEEAAGAPVAYLGRVDGPARARAFAASDVVLNPVWVGLVAVDALACGLPVVTTHHPSHSPEFEYLVDGKTALVTDHQVEAFAEAVSGLLLDERELERLSREAGRAGEVFSVQDMAQRFCAGVIEWSGGARRF